MEAHTAAEGIESEFQYTPSYDDLEDVVSLKEYTEDRVISPGMYSKNSEVGFIGSEAFYVHDEEDLSTSVAGSLMADKLMNELDIEGPQIHYDEENGKLLVQEVEGVPSNEYRITSGKKMLKHMLGRELEGAREKVDKAIGLKYFLGDSDIPPNIVVTETAAAPIDFDKTGEQPPNALDRTKEYAEEVYGHFNWEFSGEEFEETLSEMVRDLDLEDIRAELEEAVEKAPEKEMKKDYLVRNSIDNFETFK